IEIRDYHFRVLLGESRRRMFADPLPAAGNHHHLIFQHDLPPKCSADIKSEYRNRAIDSNRVLQGFRYGHSEYLPQRRKDAKVTGRCPASRTIARDSKKIS